MCHCGAAMENKFNDVNSPKKSMSTEKLGDHWEQERKKERREKLEAENWFESQQSQWPSQAELNSSDGSEHDEGGSVDKH